ncbi:MAG: hypothetical protein KGL38_12660 [Gemmatimonadota bacterium]|nr:hypothetical protein [Gemmatimonadota bacterium]
MTVPTDRGPPPSPSRPPTPGAHLPEAAEASSPLDRAMALAEVMDYVVAASKATPLVLPRPRVWIPLMTLFFFCFALYSYAAKPEWIWGTQPDPNAILATHDADMRMAIYMAAQQITAYEIEMGQLPTSLAQAGVRLNKDTVKYVVLSDTSFSLRYEAEHPIIYYSTQSAADFLGNSLNVVASSGCAKCAAQR